MRRSLVLAALMVSACVPSPTSAPETPAPIATPFPITSATSSSTSPSSASSSSASSSSASSAPSSTAASAAASEQASSAPPSASALVGRWRITGCATSPRDPAPCPRFATFTADVVTLDGNGTTPRRWTYRVVSTAANPSGARVTIDTSEETSSYIDLTPNGEASWSLSALSRVRSLSLRRE